jgi:hypothetical protein
MKRLVSALLVLAFVLAGCATPGPGSGWTVLIDGEKGLQDFSRLGDANWRAERGAIVADKAGKTSFLVTKKAYENFELYVEFFAEPTSNSGVFIRISDPTDIRDFNSYEVNIYDQRPGQDYSTGAIVNFAQVPVPSRYKAGGKWSTYEIYAKGSQVTVKLNGEVTVHMVNDKFKSGPIALQFGNRGKEPGGAIKFRKVAIRPL